MHACDIIVSININRFYCTFYCISLDFLSRHNESQLDAASSDELSMLMLKVCEYMNDYNERTLAQKRRSLVSHQRSTIAPSSDVKYVPVVAAQVENELEEEETALEIIDPEPEIIEPELPSPEIAMSPIHAISVRESSEVPPPLFPYLMELFELKQPNESGDISAKQFWVIIQVGGHVTVCYSLFASIAT